LISQAEAGEPTKKCDCHLLGNPNLEAQKIEPCEIHVAQKVGFHGPTSFAKKKILRNSNHSPSNKNDFAENSLQPYDFSRPASAKVAKKGMQFNGIETYVSLQGISRRSYSQPFGIGNILP